jgi:DNA-binding MarR family transcriptional regulator
MYQCLCALVDAPANVAEVAAALKVRHQWAGNVLSRMVADKLAVRLRLSESAPYVYALTEAGRALRKLEHRRRYAAAKRAAEAAIRATRAPEPMAMLWQWAGLMPALAVTAKGRIHKLPMHGNEPGGAS